jgi:hypothetical protein
LKDDFLEYLRRDIARKLIRRRDAMPGERGDKPWLGLLHGAAKSADRELVGS